MVGLIIFACGWGFIIPCAILTVMSSVNKKNHGMASGSLNTMRQVGGSLGLAVIGAVITTYDNKKLMALLHNTHEYMNISIWRVNHVLISAEHQFSTLSAAQSKTLIQSAKSIYTLAFSFGMLASSLFALVGLYYAVLKFGLLLIFTMIRLLF